MTIFFLYLQIKHVYSPLSKSSHLLTCSREILFSLPISHDLIFTTHMITITSSSLVSRLIAKKRCNPELKNGLSCRVPCTCAPVPRRRFRRLVRLLVVRAAGRDGGGRTLVGLPAAGSAEYALSRGNCATASWVKKIKRRPLVHVYTPPPTPPSVPYSAGTGTLAPVTGWMVPHTFA